MLRRLCPILGLCSRANASFSVLWKRGHVQIDDVKAHSQTRITLDSLVAVGSIRYHFATAMASIALSRLHLRVMASIVLSRLLLRGMAWILLSRYTFTLAIWTALVKLKLKTATWSRNARERIRTYLVPVGARRRMTRDAPRVYYHRKTSCVASTVDRARRHAYTHAGRACALRERILRVDREQPSRHGLVQDIRERLRGYREQIATFFLQRTVYSRYTFVCLQELHAYHRIAYVYQTILNPKHCSLSPLGCYW